MAIKQSVKNNGYCEDSFSNNDKKQEKEPNKRKWKRNSTESAKR